MIAVVRIGGRSADVLRSASYEAGRMLSDAWDKYRINMNGYEDEKRAVCNYDGISDAWDCAMRALMNLADAVDVGYPE